MAPSNVLSQAPQIKSVIKNERTLRAGLRVQSSSSADHSQNLSLAPQFQQRARELHREELGKLAVFARVRMTRLRAARYATIMGLLVVVASDLVPDGAGAVPVDCQEAPTRRYTSGTHARLTRHPTRRSGTVSGERRSKTARLRRAPAFVSTHRTRSRPPAVYRGRAARARRGGCARPCGNGRVTVRLGGTYEQTPSYRWASSESPFTLNRTFVYMTCWQLGL